jgi:multidrug efflux system membrane fusion protein
MTKTTIRNMALGGTAWLLLGALAACSNPEAPPEPVRAVRTQVVDLSGAGGTLEFAAEVRARVESRLGFRVPAKLTSRPAEIGQRVRPGQVLAQADPSDLRLGEEAAAAALRAAGAQYDQAASDLRRFQELRAQGFISAAEVERRDSAAKAAAAQLEQAQAQSGLQRNQAGYASLQAPAAGIVTAIEAEVGAVLAAGSTVLRLAHDGPRDAVFSVPEDQVGAARALVGRSGVLKVRPWGSSQSVPATVREVAAAADPVTRTFLVKADLGAAPVQLGQTVTALIELPRREGLVRLPLSAVMQQKGAPAVWIVDPASMTVRVQPVAVAGTDANAALLSSGLAQGQTVVVAGVHLLTPGQKVRLYGAGAATAAATAASR